MKPILTALGLAALLGMATSACVVKGQASTQPVYVVDSEPPAPKYNENVGTRPGSVWIRGHWQWSQGEWVWLEGQWQAERTNYTWEDGRWEYRDSRWHWIDGQWTASGSVGTTDPVVVKPKPPVGEYPTAPPPDPVEEDGRAEAGYVWIAGHYEWKPKKGGYVWVKGHVERAQKGKKHVHGYWENQGNRWVWVSERWDDDVVVVVPADDRPRKKPPGKKAEKAAKKAGYVWVEGHWDWKPKKGEYEWVKGHFEREQKGKKHRPGQWQQKGDYWEWVAEAWDDDVVVAPADDRPRKKPPGKKTEKVGQKKGYLWIEGHWEWKVKSGEYEWEKGHFERVREAEVWVPGEWVAEGDYWVWTAGTWKTVAVTKDKKDKDHDDDHKKDKDHDDDHKKDKKHNKGH